MVYLIVKEYGTLGHCAKSEVVQQLYQRWRSDGLAGLKGWTGQHDVGEDVGGYTVPEKRLHVIDLAVRRGDGDAIAHVFAPFDDAVDVSANINVARYTLHDGGVEVEDAQALHCFPCAGGSTL